MAFIKIPSYFNWLGQSICKKNKKERKAESYLAPRAKAHSPSRPSPPQTTCCLPPRSSKLLGGGKAWPRRHLDAERLPAPPGPHLLAWEAASKPPFISPSSGFLPVFLPRESSAARSP